MALCDTLVTAMGGGILSGDCGIHILVFCRNLIWVQSRKGDLRHKLRLYVEPVCRTQNF